jgi:hypothetical protein
VHPAALRQWSGTGGKGGAHDALAREDERGKKRGGGVGQCLLIAWQKTGGVWGGRPRGGGRRMKGGGYRAGETGR